MSGAPGSRLQPALSDWLPLGFSAKPHPTGLPGENGYLGHAIVKGKRSVIVSLRQRAHSHVNMRAVIPPPEGYSGGSCICSREGTRLRLDVYLRLSFPRSALTQIAGAAQERAEHMISHAGTGRLQDGCVAAVMMGSGCGASESV
ncbi:hypothetical protein AAFF_G00063880 [Aldrovandia affinis]|uniref:Uncharacterized protein n=1 Tax=Aldrovandia affinis TaxID=143900 RepID=A0AAD7WYM1_9TELE|nr:hypothetical protein AAFF_G00063880 [Aldrovandia affinis]